MPDEFGTAREFVWSGAHVIAICLSFSGGLVKQKVKPIEEEPNWEIAGIQSE
jgi:hypothetical protein